MPREQKITVKYRCQEICCNLLVREDKWIEHCKKFHAFKFRHGGSESVKRKAVEYKNAGGKWLNYNASATKTTTEASTDLIETPIIHTSSQTTPEVRCYEMVCHF
jgi:hypothetical protein